MLNQHRNLVIPESDLLRVGDCVVDVPRREIRSPRHDVPRRLTLKTLQVLLVLVSHHDHVVSREALLEWVWPDTMPTDDVLTQAIAQLRKAFGDERDAPRYLETIAKGGYRLVAPVSWILPEPPPAAVLELVVPVAPVAPSLQDASIVAPPAPRWWRVPAYALVGVLLVGLMIAAVAWLPRLRNQGPAVTSVPLAAPIVGTTAPANYQRITSLPGSEMYPSLSPDGSQVVYSAYSDGGHHADLMVQTTAPVPGRRLMQAPPGMKDTMPVWSPDGRQIAFVRQGPQDQCSILLIPASGGDARTITRCKPGWEAGVSWHPDGKHLLTTLMGVAGDDGAIYTIDLASGAWTRLRYQKGVGDIDMSPQYSPDGRWIAFHRNISLGDLWRMPATGGEPERLTQLRTNIYSLAWAPDGQSIVFARYLDGTVWMSRLDLRTRQVSDLGLPNTAFPSIAANAASLAFTIYQSRSAIFSIDLGHPSSHPPAPTPVFPSTGLDLVPSIAPDGRQIAFMSNRSARLGLWWAQLGRDESLRLIEGVIPVPRYPAAWSEDSKRMLVIGRADSDPTNTPAGVFELVPESGSVRRLPIPAGEAVHADYVPGSSRILVVADRGAGRLGVTLYDSAVTPWKPLASIEDVALTRVDQARARILFTRPSKSGLWQADMSLKGARQISDRPAVGGGRRLIVEPDRTWLAGTDEACGLAQVPIPQGKPSCLLPAPLGVTGVSLDRVHQRLYFAAEQEELADIGWMRLPTQASR
jgi:Tol biopolymer transport system component/DNA-binding winged helix-turn-helix (wHTH) protein